MKKKWCSEMPDSLDGSRKKICRLTGRRRIYFLTDTTVYRLWKSFFGAFPVVVIPPGEKHKNLKTIETIVRKLTLLGCDRESVLIGVGGGVVCDMAGFTASVFMRGIRFGLIPTTLLAQADASLGGKNGVNSDGYKNLVGLFREPWFVESVPAFLDTLPESELRNGLSEMIKHGLICDKSYYEWTKVNARLIMNRDASALKYAVERSAYIKTGITVRDFNEKNERMKLNFGHTFGHAIEKLYGFTHGHAVSLGMILEAAVSDRYFNDNEKRAWKLAADFRSMGQPTDTFQLNSRHLFECICRDKKKDEDRLHFVFLRSPGISVIEKVTLTSLKRICHDSKFKNYLSRVV